MTRRCGTQMPLGGGTGSRFHCTCRRAPRKNADQCSLQGQSWRAMPWRCDGAWRCHAPKASSPTTRPAFRTDPRRIPYICLQWQSDACRHESSNRSSRGFRRPFRPARARSGTRTSCWRCKDQVQGCASRRICLFPRGFQAARNQPAESNLSDRSLHWSRQVRSPPRDSHPSFVRRNIPLPFRISFRSFCFSYAITSATSVPMQIAPRNSRFQGAMAVKIYADGQKLSAKVGVWLSQELTPQAVSSRNDLRTFRQPIHCLATRPPNSRQGHIIYWQRLQLS